MYDNVIDVKKPYRGNAIVCVLDLLGFSNYVNNNWHTDIEDPVHPVSIWSYLKEVSCAIEKNPMNTRAYEGDSTIEITHNPIIRIASDTIIIIMPTEDILPTEDLHFMPKLFCSIIKNIINIIGKMWRYSLNAGFTIRGGISHGGIYYDDDITIGPAFIDAYKAENSIACISRVICTNSIVKFIADLIERETIAKNILNRFYFDIDGWICIKPDVMLFGAKNKEALLGEILLKLDELRHGKDEKIKIKYERLYKILAFKDKAVSPTREELTKYSS